MGMEFALAAFPGEPRRTCVVRATRPNRKKDRRDRERAYYGREGGSRYTLRPWAKGLGGGIPSGICHFARGQAEQSA